MGAKHQHQRAESSLEHYEFLLEALELVHAHRDLASLLPALADRLRRVVEFDNVHIALYDSARNAMRLHLLEARLPIRAETGDELPVEECPQGLVWQMQQVFIINDIARETRFPQFVERLRESGVRSYYVLPLTSVGKPLGAITFASRDESAWSESDLNYLKYVAKAIAITVDNALLFRQVEEQRDKLAQEKICLEEEIRDIHNFADFIGGSPALRRVLKQIEIVAPTDSTVLLQGETGTGKELVARAIHNLSPRRERTIMKVDCAAMPTELLQSELFGHERGAFTGAFARRIGRFELADKGTLFLDEIGDLPLPLQPKLLRVLQEREFERLGGVQTIRVDVRVVAATNRDLFEMVESGEFRSDLYYRLNVFPINLPPLRERRQDIPLLVSHFTQKFARRMKKRIETIPAEALATLAEYDFPGNVRELENLIERAVILSPGNVLEIPLAELRRFSSGSIALESTSKKTIPTAATETLEAVEREHILRVLRDTDWVIGGKSGAAARLGIKRTTLQSRMSRLGITRPEKS